ncbi:MAG TPA: porin family protein [Vicinamibacterales bacterium]|nr:porin family protein [Vicinamibacterales bacterium]
MPRSSLGAVARSIALAAVVFLVTLVSARADAQTFGAKGGLNFSTITIEDFDTAGKASAVAGGFVRMPLFVGIGLQVEGLFAQRRVTFEDTVRDDLNYVEIPLLARYRVMTVGGRAVHVLGGGVLGLRLSAREIISGQSYDIKEAYEPVEVGAAIGGEVALTRHWLVDVRYVFGMSNAYNVPGFEGKFRTLQVTVGYGF